MLERSQDLLVVEAVEALKTFGERQHSRRMNSKTRSLLVVDVHRSFECHRSYGEVSPRVMRFRLDLAFLLFQFHQCRGGSASLSAKDVLLFRRAHWRYLDELSAILPSANHA